MAFFSKLKERLFKSSSKIDEGLEAIVGQGGEAELPGVDEVMETAPAAATEVLPEAVDPEPAPMPAQEEPDIAESARRDAHAAEAEAQAARRREVEARVAEAEREAALKARQEAAAQQQREAATAAERMAAERAAREAEAEARRQEEARAAARAAAEAAAAEARRRAEAEAEAEKRREAERPVVAEAAPVAKPGLLGRLMGRTTAAPVMRRALDDAMLEQLEELLISADMGVDTALRVTANMAEGRFGAKLSVAEIKDLMAQEIARIMEPVAKPLPLYAKTPQVVLVVGVNGSGKTTTIGKFASQFRAAGKKVVIAAGDTFRAAAVEQLQVWGDRAGVPVLTAAQGSDPASLAFDAMTKAQADGADLLLIDTAGRLQNRGDLMEELAKIVRVIRKKDETAPHNTLLVLDATTGQNALNQVKVFQEISDVSGLVMTKLDGTAKGGVLVALADKFGLPIHAIGVGEQIDDLQPFDPDEFAAALVGLER